MGYVCFSAISSNCASHHGLHCSQSVYRNEGGGYFFHSGVLKISSILYKNYCSSIFWLVRLLKAKKFGCVLCTSCIFVMVVSFVVIAPPRDNDRFSVNMLAIQLAWSSPHAGHKVCVHACSHSCASQLVRTSLCLTTPPTPMPQMIVTSRRGVLCRAGVPFRLSKC